MNWLHILNIRHVLSFVVAVTVAPAFAATNDPLFSSQWYLQNTGQPVNGAGGVVGADISAVPAWAIHGGTSAVIVAVVSTGVTPHEDLSGNLLTGRAFSGDPFLTHDTCGTGTMVAGIIGAQRDNGLGMAGLAGNVKLLPVRVYPACGGTAKEVAAGLVWAVDQGADIIALPGLHYTETAELLAAVTYAAQEDVLVVAPLGDSGTNLVSFPAAYDSVLAVTATGHDDQPAPISLAGAQADISAPGVGIWSTDRLGGYSETPESVAATVALVAGAAALVKSYAPQLSMAQVRSILESTATDLGAAGRDDVFGWGRLDVEAALLSAPPPVLRFELLSDPPQLVAPGTPAVFDLRIANGTQVVVPAQARFFHRSGTGAFASTTMQSLGSGLYRATLPAYPCHASVDYYLSATGHLGGVVREPLDAPASTFDAWAVRLRTLFHEDAETDRGWTTSPPGALQTQGAWTRGIPVATLAADGSHMQPGFDFSPGTKQACFYTGMHTPGAAVGTSDVDGGPYTLTSPEITLTTPDALISYARWLFWLGNGVEDFLMVEASRDGGANWALVETVAHTSGWSEHEFRVSDIPGIAGNRLRVRFTVADLDNMSLTEAAVDEFRVQAIDCSAATGDGDNDGLIALADHALMQGCVTGPGISFPNPVVCSLFDFEADGDVDLSDVAAFGLRFGAPP